MVYLPSGQDNISRVALALRGASSVSSVGVSVARPDGSGGVTAASPGEFFEGGTGLGYLTDTWQEWDLDYVIGADTFGVCVAGSCASGFSTDMRDLAQGSISNDRGTDGVAFVDAVASSSVGTTPVPATLPLAVSGFGALLAMLRLRRRRPKASC